MTAVGGPRAAVARRLTPGEEALWLLQELVGPSGVSNMALALTLGEPPRWWPLREALRWLVERHPALRTSVTSRDGGPHAVVHPVDACPVEVDMFAATRDGLEDDLTAYAALPFRLDRVPLLRAGVFTVAPDEHHLCLSAHHIAVDSASLATLVDEILHGYAELAETDGPPALPAPERLEPTPTDPSDVRYWRDHLDGYDSSGMRLDGAREPGPAPLLRGDTVRRDLTPDERTALATLRGRHRVTDAIVLLAAYHAVLRRAGAGPDQVVGVMVDTRGGRGTTTVGYHVSTLPLRLRVDDDAPVGALVDGARDAMVGGLPHAAVSFEQIAADRPVADGPGGWRTRLVRHLFNVRQRGAAGSAAGRAAAVREVSTRLSRFDLELIVQPGRDAMELTLLYATEVHERPFAERLLEQMGLVLRGAATEGDLTVGALDLRTAADHRIVDDANATAVDWPGPATVAEMIVAAARARPDAVAVVDAGRRITYGQLLGGALRARDEVASHGARAGDVVAVALPRGAATAAAVLGIWMAGAAYLPLDPDHPPARLAVQLADSGCRLMFATGPGEVDGVRQLAAPGLDTADPAPADGRWAAPPAGSLAYLIYTSGSTGQPKGVRLTHANLRNVVGDFQRRLSAGPDDAMLWLTTFAFDISTLELCLPLAVGGRVVVATDTVRTAPDELLALIERHAVTVVQATPTTWRLLAPPARGRLAGRTVLCGGEPLPATLLRHLRATGARVLNVYGPTETTIWSTTADLTADLTDGGALPVVGRPLANTTAHILDDRERPLSVARSGDLWIAGAGVADGYHRRPGLTAASFRDDPVRGRRYRTGDLARWRPDGTLELLGRSDRQVKLRAHRIELGEVEAVMEEHAEVGAAAVILHGDPSGDGYLVAFVAATDRAGLADELWAHASARLPTYCVPGRIVVLPALPVNTSGKVDLPALAARPVAGSPARGNGAAAEPPPASAPAVLVDLWRTVLGNPKLSADANFFLFGGTSLRAVDLARDAAAALGREVTMGMIFRAPTPAALAALLDEVTTEGGDDRASRP